MSIYLETAARMMKVKPEDLPNGLKNDLKQVDELCKIGGSSGLISHQIIALIVWQFQCDCVVGRR